MEDFEERKGRVLERAKEDNVKFVNLRFIDMLGGIKNITIPVEQLEDSFERGTWFDGSSIEGFMRIAESDMILMPDPDTYAVLPWEPQEKATARLICDVYTPNGKPFEGDPRYILKRALKEAEDMGYIYNTGPELEFFLFKKNGEGPLRPVPHDIGGYFDYSPQDMASAVRRDIIFAVEKLGLFVEASHHEVAPGQHEIDFKYGHALASADSAISMKHAVKAISYKHDLYATFMPKPIFGENGSGMHVHQSLFTPNGEPAFYDEKDKYNLSDLAKQFIAGQLEHVKAMSAVLSPTVNSYKRLVPGYEAAVYICWAQMNRSALIRVPRISPDRRKSARAELRCPDPSCNPYLAFAVMLHAGLDGIKKKKKPPEPVEEDVYHFNDAKLKERYINTLPASLGEAISDMQGSELMKKALGKHTYQKYIDIKKAEWDSYRIHVTDWEINQYLDKL